MLPRGHLDINVGSGRRSLLIGVDMAARSLLHSPLRQPLLFHDQLCGHKGLPPGMICHSLDYDG